MDSFFKRESLKKVSVGDFCGYLFCVRDDAHLTHLAQPTKTLAAHEALDELYKDWIDLMDSFIEKYQGIYGIVKVNVPPVKAYEDPLQMVTEKYKYIQEYRGIFKDSFLQNIIDEMSAVLATALYKLRFVK